MPRGSVRLKPGVLIVVAALVGLLIGAAPAAAAPAAPRLAAAPIEGAENLNALSACLAEKKTGDLALLIDTSGSLSGTGGGTATDPTDVRVAAAQSLLGGLATSFANVGASVDVTIAGFSDDVDPIVPFQALTTGSLPSVDDQVAQFADRDKGGETDYWTALTWLNRTLQDKAQQRPGACQFAIWFTDGEFTIYPRDGSSLPGVDPYTSQTKDIPGFEDRPLTDQATADAALAAAKQEMCRPGGTADAMRAAGITMIGVGLGTDSSNFDFMRSYVENPTGSPCGELPGTGVFVTAQSVGDLFLTLSQIGENGTQSAITEVGVCQGQPCPEGRYAFQLDDTIDAVHLSAVVGDSQELLRGGIQVVLTPPTGQGTPITINGDGKDRDTATTDVATATYQWFQGGPLGVDLRRTAADKSWAGEWSVTVVDTTGQHPDAVSKIVLSLSSNIAVAPVAVDRDNWRVGQSAQVIFQAQTRDGQPLPDGTELSSALTASATVTAPDGTVGPSVPVILGQPLTVDPTAAGSWTITTSVDGQVAGQALEPVSRQVAVEVKPPLGAGELPPNQMIDFGAIEGTAAAAGTLTVIGPAEGEACVQVSVDRVQAPRADVTPRIETPSPGACFSVAAGQTVAVPLTLTPSAEANGLMTGTVTVQLAPASDPSRVSEQQVPFRVAMQRLPSAPALWLVLAFAILLGLLVPFLAIWLMRRLSARFPDDPSTPLVGTAMDVRLTDDRMTAPDGQPVRSASTGWAAVPPPGPGRRTLLLSGVALRARAGWRLSEPGYAELDEGSGPGSVGAGDATPSSDKQGRPRLPLAIEGSWAVVAPAQLAISSIDAVTARLLLIIDTRADESQRSQLLQRAAEAAPAAFAQARRKARAAAGGDADSGGSSGPGGPGGHPQGGPSASGGGWGTPSPSGPSAGSGGWGPGGGGSPQPGGWNTPSSGGDTQRPGTWSPAPGPTQPGWGAAPGGGGPTEGRPGGW